MPIKRKPTTIKPTRNAFGTWLRTARVSRDLTLVELGAKVHMSCGSLSSMETGKNGATKNNIEKLAAFFGVPESQIANLDGSQLDPLHRTYNQAYYKAAQRAKKDKDRATRLKATRQERENFINLHDLQDAPPEKFVRMIEENDYVGTR